MPSRLLLPVIPGVSAPTGLPPCPGLRGEPCRDYQPFDNQAASLTPDTTATPGNGTQGSSAQPSVGSTKKKKCKKRKRGRSAEAARKKCRKKHAGR